MRVFYGFTGCVLVYLGLVGIGFGWDVCFARLCVCGSHFDSDGHRRPSHERALSVSFSSNVSSDSSQLSSRRSSHEPPFSLSSVSSDLSAQLSSRRSSHEPPFAMSDVSSQFSSRRSSGERFGGGEGEFVMSNFADESHDLGRSGYQLPQPQLHSMLNQVCWIVFLREVFVDRVRSRCIISSSSSSSFKTRAFSRTQNCISLLKTPLLEVFFQVTMFAFVELLVLF